MKFNFSFTTKIFIKVFLSVLILTVIINWISFYLYTQETKAYFFEQAKNEISNSINRNIENLKNTSVDQYCETLKKTNNYRVTVVSSSGKVLCDTFIALFDNHLDRPEIKNADFNTPYFETRFSDTTKLKMVYGAQKFKMNNEWNFIRISVPLISIESGLSGLYKNAVIKVVPVIALIIIIFFIISIRYSKSLTNVLNKSLSLAQRFRIKKNDSLNLGSLENILDQVDHEFEKNFEALRFEIEKNSTLLQSISDGILAIDLNKRILFYNVRFTRFFNYHKATEKNLYDLLGSRISESFEVCLKTGSEQKIFGFKIDDKFIDLSVAPILGKNSKTLGAIGIFRNVTEKKRVEQMRVEFVANVSHELKTPLTSIKGYSQLLLDDEKLDFTKTKNYITKILNNSERLIDLFENLLTLSKIESTDNLKYSVFHIEDHVQEIIEYLKSKNPHKVISVEQVYNAQSFQANEKLFRQVIFNLLENAVKYSKDEVKIKIYTKREKDQILISIEDNGIGIAEDKLSRVFERFYRANESRSNEIKGSGIGLSIVKHIVDKHKGIVEVFSLKEGTEFLIKLPY